jgi:hypothetical protein
VDNGVLETAMTRWDVFRFVSDRLASRLFSSSVPTPAGDVPWALAIEAADRHMVAPALGWCIRGDVSVSADVTQCLETLLELNRQRNAVIQRALDAGVASLNDAGIVPMLLKGAAALTERLYPDPGMRIVGDLDLLVSDAQVADAEAALARAGFGLEAPLVSFDRDPHHRPPLLHKALRVRVDLHTRPLPDAPRQLLDASRMLAMGREEALNRRRVLLPDPHDWLAHTMAHSQIDDGHNWRGIPRLRHDAELGLIARRYPGVMDRVATDGRWAGTPDGRIFVETVLLTEVLLRQRDDPALSGREARVVERMRRAVERPGSRRWTLYRQFVLRNARRVIEHPRFFLRPLRPSFWVRYGAQIRKGAQVGRW